VNSSKGYIYPSGMNVRQQSELPVDPISSLNNAIILHPLVLNMLRYSSEDKFLVVGLQDNLFFFSFFMFAGF
jgi:hypothetical protein